MVLFPPPKKKSLWIRNILYLQHSSNIAYHLWFYTHDQSPPRFISALGVGRQASYWIKSRLVILLRLHILVLAIKGFFVICLRHLWFCFRFKVSLYCLSFWSQMLFYQSWTQLESALLLPWYFWSTSSFSPGFAWFLIAISQLYSRILSFLKLLECRNAYKNWWTVQFTPAEGWLAAWPPSFARFLVIYHQQWVWKRF